MNWKTIVWKYVTLIVVALIVLNPETAQLAIFIDAIGLEVFLMLLEIQVVTMVGLLFGSKIKPIIVSAHRCLLGCFRMFSLCGIFHDRKHLLLEVSGTAALMHLLVFSAVIGAVLSI